MAVRDYSGSVRPIDSVLEGRARVVEWDHADGSIFRGYQLGDGRLTGACFVQSASRQAAMAAAVTARTADETQIANFKASIVDLATKVKNNTATAAEQRTLLVKLSRAVLGLLSDLP